ncbi:MAG: TIGR01841 family phasin [Burkholderiales bacterium]
MTNPQEQFLDFYRAGLKATLDMMKASYEGAERLRSQQLEAINSALAANTQLAAEISGANSVEQLMALQTKLAGVQAEAVIGYWRSLGQAAVENQAETSKRVQAQVAQIGDSFRDSLKAVPGGNQPILQAFQSLVDATSSAYAVSARATEEAAKLAAAQIATANAGIRQAVADEGRKTA